MNDFDTEPETTDFETEMEASETDAEVVASGLLPREVYRPSTRLEVVDDPEEAHATRRMYREIQIRINSTRSVLLVGPWCEIRPGRAYRARKRDNRVREPTVGTETPALLTVEIVAECDAETRLHRV